MIRTLNSSFTIALILTSLTGLNSALSKETDGCADPGKTPDSIKDNKESLSLTSNEVDSAGSKINFEPKSLDDFPGAFVKRMETIDVRRDVIGMKVLSALTHELGTMLPRGAEHPPITAKQIRSLIEAYERLVPGEKSAGLAQKLEPLLSQLASIAIKHEKTDRKKESEEFIKIKFMAIDKSKGIQVEEPSMNLKATISDGATMKLRSTNDSYGELTDLLVKVGPKDYLVSKEIRKPRNVARYLSAFEYPSYGVGKAKKPKEDEEEEEKKLLPNEGTPSPLWMKLEGFTGLITEPAKQEGKKPKITKIKIEEAGLFHGFKTELDSNGVGSDLVFKIGGKIPSLVNRLFKTLKVKFSADAGPPKSSTADDVLPPDP